MNLEKIVDFFVYGILELGLKHLPFRILRFFWIPIAYVILLITSFIWIPLAILCAFIDMWNDVKDKP